MSERNNIPPESQERQDSEKLLRKIVENYPNSYLSIIEKNLTIGFASGQEFKKQNLDPNSIVGQSPEQIFGEKAPFVREKYLQAFDGQPVEFELILNNRHEMYRVVPLADDGACIERILVVVENISGRKLAEKTPFEISECYQKTLDNMLEGCQIIDYDWRYLYVNEAVIRQGRQTRSKFLGHTMMQVYPGIEDTELFGYLRRCMEERQPQHRENEFIYPDGSKAWFELSIQPIPEGLFILSLDITERKQTERELAQHREHLESLVAERTAALETSEQRYYQLFQQAPNSVILIDAETGALVEFNTRAYESLGFSRDEFSRLKISDLEVNESAEVVADHIEKVKQEGSDTFETRHRTRNGEIRDIRVAVAPLKIRGKMYLQSIWSDITDEKKAAKALRQSQEEAAHSNRMLLALSQAATAIQHALTPQAVFEMVGKQVHELGFHAIIFSLDQSKTSMILEHMTFEPALIKTAENLVQIPERGFRIKFQEEGFFAQVLTGAQAVYFDDVCQPISEAFPDASPKSVQEIASLLGLKQIVLAPLITNDETMGILGVTGLKLQATDIPAVTTFANQIAIALKNTRSNAKLKRRVAELLALNTMTTITNEAQNVDEVLNRAMDEVLHQIGIKAGTMMMIDKTASSLVMATHRGLSQAFVNAFSRMELDEGLSGKVVQTGQAAVLRNLSDYPQAKRAYVEAEKIQSASVVPLMSHKGVIGTMNLGATSPHFFDNAGVEWLTSLGRQIGIGVEKIRSEIALRRSEENYRQLFENAQVGMYRSKIDGSAFLAVNEKFTQIFGYSKEKILSEPTIILWADPEDRVEMLRQIREKGILTDYLIPIVNKAGEIRTCLISIKLYAEDGFLEGSIIDITERIQTEEALRDSEEKFRGLYESVRDGIIRTDMQGKILECNPALCEMLGYTLEELQQRTNANLTPAKWHAKENEILTGQIIPRGYSDVYEKEYIRKDGSVFSINLRVWLVKDVKGKSTVMWGTIRDITERKLGERAIRLQAAIARNMAEGVHITRTDDGTIIYTNESFDAIFGYKAGELIGQPVSVLNASTNRTAEELAAEIMQKLSEDGVWHGEILNRRKDATPFWCEASVSTLEDPEHGTIWVSVHQDITQRKQSEAALRKLNIDLRRRQSALEAANNELEAFAYSVSHDLRSPLRGMDGYSKLLLTEHAEQLDEDGRFMLDQVHESAVQMGQLIDDLLEFSRTGRREMQFQKFCINDIVEEQFDRIRRDHPDRRFRLEGGKLPTCSGDAAMIREVLQNLLDNAAKFTRTREEAVIEVGSQSGENQTDSGQPAILYYVRDNGVGFDPRFQNKLFQVFQRLHRVDDFEGTGIGLALVRRIIQRHGGKTWAESEPDKGATFFFTLPVEQTEDTSDVR